MAESCLCTRCRGISFASLFVTPQRDVTLPTLGELWTQKRCRFCDLLRHALVTHYGSEYMLQKARDEPEKVLYAAQTPVDPRCDWNELYAEKRPGAFYLELHARGPEGTSLERIAKKTNDEFNESWFLPKIQLLRTNGLDPPAAYGKATLPGAVDWDYIRGWVRSCDGKHAWTDIVDLSSIPMLTIDVHKMCVVPMPPGPVRYIALSYMWGKDQAVKLKRDTYSLLTTRGAFSQATGLALSRTIRDAMRASKLLGSRYLWVDALCVIQDDPAHLRANMGAMDKVYMGAWLTIVAAAGDDADGGLPGVYPDLPRAETQMAVEIPQDDGRSVTVGNMLDSAKASLNFSTWDTRGWTYQERVLSRRLLSFTHAQAYFHCDRGCSCREDMYPVTSPDEDGAGDSFNSGYELSFEYDDLFTLYASATARYTHRQLTKHTDKVNAFQGVLNHLAGPFQGPFFFGLPSTVFDAALLWEPAGRCKRMGAEFPSWSWAGWDGPVRYAMKDRMANLCECVVSVATVETASGLRLCETCDGRSPALARANGTRWSRCFDEDTLEVYYSTDYSPLAGYKYPRPLAPPRHVSGQLDTDQDAFADPVLRIRGHVATLFVSDRHNSAGDALSTCSKGTHTHCHLQLLDSKNRVVGLVLVDRGDVSDISGKRQRLLALSRSTLHRMDDDPSWDPETRTFRSWTHPESGAPGDEEESSESDDELAAIWSGMRKRWEFFDAGEFNPRVFWPVLNVLLLSDGRKDGVVERVGVGKVHIDGFMPAATEEDLFLG